MLRAGPVPHTGIQCAPRAAGPALRARTARHTLTHSHAKHTDTLHVHSHRHTHTRNTQTRFTCTHTVTLTLATHRHTHMRIHTDTYSHAHTQTHTLIHKHRRTCTHTCTDKHTCTHAHTHTQHTHRLAHAQRQGPGARHSLVRPSHTSSSLMLQETGAPGHWVTRFRGSVPREQHRHEARAAYSHAHPLTSVPPDAFARTPVQPHAACERTSL